MEEVKKDKTSCNVIIIVILMIMVLGLGGYIFYEKTMSKDSNVTTPKTEELDDKEELNKIDLTKSLNTSSTYSYKIIDNNLSEPMTIKLNSDNKSATIQITGFSDEDDDIKGGYKVTGFNKKIKEIFIGLIGQDITGYVALFLMEDNTIEYVHIFRLADEIECEFNNETKDGYITQGTIEGVNDIAKMQLATLTINSDETHYMYTTTVLAVKEDGSFYDLYNTKANKLDVLE